LRKSDGDACCGRRAGIDAAGRFRCPRCRADLSPLELVQKVRRCDEAAARAWLQEQIAADAKEHAPTVPVDGVRAVRMWDLGRTKRKRNP
jgi:hypothetical protein